MTTIESVTLISAGSGTFTAVMSAPLAMGEVFVTTRDPLWLDAPISCTDVLVAGSTYTVTIPPPNSQDPPFGIFWVATSLASEKNSNVLPLVCLGSIILPYTLGARALQSIIQANKPVIDLMLTQIAPSVGQTPAAQLQQVIYGPQWAVERQTPGVLIKPYQYTERYEGDMERWSTITYSVTAMVRETDAIAESDLVGQFADTLRLVLNQMVYSTYTLPGGIIVNGGQTGDVTGFQDDMLDAVWASRATFTWSWDYIQRVG